jgi:2-haloacid dehalogenase
MTYSHLLFDADGTLFDYDRGEAKALAATFEETGIPYIADYTNIYRQINAQMWSDFEQGKISQKKLRSERFGRLFHALNIRADPLLFSERYQTNLGQATDLIDGAPELLQALHENHYLLLITNGIPEVQRSRLSLSPIQDYFDAIIISGEIGVAKPDPRIFDAAFQAMGNPPKQKTLVIGDSLTSDIQGGLNYGIDTCWFNPEQHPPNPAIPATHQIHSLSQLPPLLNHPTLPVNLYVNL